MTKLITTIGVAIAVLFLSIPVTTRAQTADPIADKNAVDKLMHDYFEAFSRGDMAAVTNFDFGVKLLGPSYAIAGGTYVRYKTDGSEIGRSGGTYLLNKVDGVWKIGVVMGYPVKDAFKPE